VNSAGRSRIPSAIGRVLYRHKRMILATTFAAAILAAIVSLLLPKTYTATARILPPKEEAGGLGSVWCGPFGDATAAA